MSTSNLHLQRYVDAFRNAVLSKIPQDRNSRLILATSSSAIAALILYPLLHHTLLGRRVHHTHPNASSRSAAQDCGEVASLPAHLIASPTHYRVAHDKVSHHLRDLAIDLGADHGPQFTQLLRYTFARFSRAAPQAWVLWMAAGGPEARRTFDAEWVAGREFVVGDVVCGVFEVVERTPLRAEIAIRAAAGTAGKVSGLMVVSLRPRNEGVMVVTETIQWARKDAGVTLPLDRWVVRFLHEWTARWLVVEGARYLSDITSELD